MSFWSCFQSVAEPTADEDRRAQFARENALRDVIEHELERRRQETEKLNTQEKIYLAEMRTAALDNQYKNPCSVPEVRQAADRLRKVRVAMSEQFVYTTNLRQINENMVFGPSRECEKSIQRLRVRQSDLVEHNKIVSALKEAWLIGRDANSVGELIVDPPDSNDERVARDARIDVLIKQTIITLGKSLDTLPMLDAEDNPIYAKR